MPLIYLTREYRNHAAGEILVVSPGKAEELVNLGFGSKTPPKKDGGAAVVPSLQENPPPSAEGTQQPPPVVAPEEKKKGKRK